MPNSLSLIARQTGLLCTQPLRGYYRYRDLFQILPVDVPSGPILRDYPMIVEICYCPDSPPDHPQTLWYRDLWEQERFEHVNGYSSGNVWLAAYKSLTKQMRWPAITEEVSGLLTLFTNHRFFSYATEHKWFISTETGAPTSAEWGQLGYSFDLSKSGTELSDHEFSAVKRIPGKEYFGRTRDAIYAGSDNTVQLPESVDRFFDLYFKVDAARKKGFLTACRLYNKALELRSTSASLSLVAAVMAIEALVNCTQDDGPKCKECGSPQSIETCSVCRLPRHRATSRFQGFISKFVSQDHRKFAGILYNTRSKLAHGGLLREDLHDSGFYAGNKDDEATLRRESLKLTRIAILNWLTDNDSV